VFKHQGPAHLDRVVFKIIPEDATRLATLENAETNFIETVPEQDLARLRADSRFKLIVGSIPGLPIGVFLNTQKEPTDALEVRQAILQGLSRADIIKTVYFGAYEPAHGPLARTPSRTTRRSRACTHSTGAEPGSSSSAPAGKSARARTTGCRDARIVARHILPNIVAPVIVVATLGVAGAILTGRPRPPSWAWAPSRRRPSGEPC
jgi:Bacterial extracellular solute-binding proteins, family 5 Middle